MTKINTEYTKKLEFPVCPYNMESFDDVNKSLFELMV